MRHVTTTAVRCADVEELRNADLNAQPVHVVISEAIATIGENLSLRRMASIEGDHVASYVHNAAADGMGKIGVLVAVSGTDNGIAKQIAMHIAATSPLALSEAELDPAVLERELHVQTQKALEENAASDKPKPDAVIHNNIIPGRMKRFLSENTLMGQAFVINPDLTVAQAADAAGVKVTGFIRMACGEGIEKKEEDFAAEVAKMVQG